MQREDVNAGKDIVDVDLTLDDDNEPLPASANPPKNQPVKRRFQVHVPPASVRKVAIPRVSSSRVLPAEKGSGPVSVVYGNPNGNHYGQPFPGVPNKSQMAAAPANNPIAANESVAWNDPHRRSRKSPQILSALAADSVESYSCLVK